MSDDGKKKTQVGAEPTITQLPPELIQKILGWASPRSIKQFSQTCRGYRESVQDYEGSPGYAGLLVSYALEQFTAGLVTTHARCSKDDPALLTAKATAYAQHVAAILAGCPDKPISDWNMVNYLQCLYPAACLPDWPAAPYALEWCARRERAILGVKRLGPRHELLALLCEDAPERLTALKSGYGSKRPTVIESGKHPPALEDPLGFTARARRRSRPRVTFTIAVMASSIICSSEWYPGMHGLQARPPISIKLSLLRVAANLLCQNELPAEDQAWLYLAGLGKNNKRSPKKLLGKFDSRSGKSQDATHISSLHLLHTS